MSHGCGIYAFPHLMAGARHVVPASGGVDPATPPRHGEQVARTLPRVLHLVAPYLGHGVTLHGCAPELIQLKVEKCFVLPIVAKQLERQP
jgi:hypothetical protein